jgi:hypothetical protein
MAQLNVKLPDENLQALRRFAAKRRTPVAWLIKDYIAYLVAGGSPVSPPPAEELDSKELAELAGRGGAFDWLADEPDPYSLDDGEPV